MITMNIVTKEMNSLQGVNRMTEKFILGSEYFYNKGIKLNKLITSQYSIDVPSYTSRLGEELTTESYIKKRKMIEKIKMNPLYHSAFIQKRLCENGWKSEKEVFKYADDIESGDIVFFQTIGAAYYYLGNRRNYSNKTIFISHADTDPLEQLLLSRKEIQGTRYEKTLRERYEIVFRSVDSVITICSASKQYMLENYGLDCPMIINGIEDIQYNANVKKYSQRDNKIHFVSVGSIITRKGFDIIVEAVNCLKSDIRGKAIFHFVGTGKDYSLIKRMIDDYKLQDMFMLHGPLMDVNAEIEKMDVFLFPTRSDTVPVSIIESLRAGVPVFASAVGEIPNMIDEGAGHIIESNIESTEQAIKEIIEGKYDLNQMGQNARQKYIASFTLEKMCNSYSKVILKL